MVVESTPILDQIPPREYTSLSTLLESTCNEIIDKSYSISRDEALQIASIDKNDALLLFHYAHKIRNHFRGDKVGLCSIVNAKSGACPEDCTFCAQSAHFKTASPVYEMMPPEEVVKQAQIAKNDGAEAFGIVISGKGIKNQRELEQIGDIVKKIRKEVDIDVHGSFGILSREHVDYLRDCGVTMINHNLETSERHYSNLCSTHTFQERIDTLRYVRESGMKLCAGGIFGVGETLEDRVDMALQLRDLAVETVPMNFLHPIPGTPLNNLIPLSPITCLMTIALYRFILPTQEIKICGGREKNLRDLQSMIFFAGADSMMIGNYLTTAGREPEQDWQMLRDMELTWEAQNQE